MSRSDLQVSVLQASSARIDGRVADDMAASPWIRAGAEVTIFLNPPHTRFRDAEISGSGRIYEGRIEIDLLLPPIRLTALLAGLENGTRLRFQTAEITESLFRVEAIATG